jgi:hypothetical protein
MVADSRETLYAGAGKPLNVPEPVEVKEDKSGRPVIVKSTRRQAVATIESCWRIDDEWWRSEPIARIYYAVMLASGQRLIIYKDLTGNSWYRQSY